MASTLNLASLKTPGVYIEERPLFPPSVVQVETAIPAFIGYTEIAKNKTDDDLINIPKRIKSLLDFEKYYGKAPQEGGSITVTLEESSAGVKASATIDEPTRSAHILYYALQLFYANGGGDCYIASVGNFTDDVALGTVTGSGMLRGLTEIARVDEPTLLVFPESFSLADGDILALYDAALAQADELSDRFVIMDAMRDIDVQNTDTDAVDTSAADFRSNRVGTEHLKYGAVYTPFVKTTFDFNYDEATVNISHIVNGAATGTFNGQHLADVTDSALKSKALLAITNLENILPPSAGIAGLYASVDNDRGVWKAPANVSLKNVTGPTHLITDKDQELLNVNPGGKSINAIRSFTGRGTLVWGARTLAGNDNEWRYISVRRFFNMVEESIKRASIPFVFEPNDANTWVRIRAMIENFLTLQWRAGALAGAKPEHAFYVRVGLGQTMTAEDILNGFMIIEIGMAVVRPAEFIILRFSHKMQES
jgi:uncharacterized protein